MIVAVIQDLNKRSYAVLQIKLVTLVGQVFHLSIHRITLKFRSTTLVAEISDFLIKFLLLSL